jgi:DNA repair exonuclease SbcCD nuclease subunit
MTRDIRDRLELFASGHLGWTDANRISVERIALNWDQVEQYSPPPNPAKLTDSRGAGYVACTATSSWELDALEPTVLAGPDRRPDQEDVGHQIARLAVDLHADLVLDGGDVFEGPTITPAQLDAYIRPLESLGGLIPILAITGNGRHDLAMREVNALAPLRHVPGLIVESVPEIHLLAGVAVACLPWAPATRVRAARARVDVDEVNQDTADLVVQIAAGLREDCARVAPDAPAVLLAHWSISGASLPSGLPIDQAREPIIPLSELAELGFDAIVASHIHRPQFATRGHGWQPPWHTAGDTVVGDRVVTKPPIFYTGAPQQHDHGDAGQPRGAWLLDLSRTTATAEFFPLAGRRFVTLDLGSDADTEFGLGEAVSAAGGADVLDDAIVRVRYTATPEQARRIDVDALRRAIEHVAYSVKIEQTLIRAQTARVEGLDETLTEESALELYLGEHPELAPRAGAIRERVADYLEAVRS